MSDRLAALQSGNIAQPVYGSPVFSKVANGTGVKVYRCFRFTPQGKNKSSPWALKKMNRSIGRIESVVSQRLNKEAEILQTLDHEHIIKLKLVQGVRDSLVDQSLNCLNLEFGGEALNIVLQKACDTRKSIIAFHFLKIITDILKALVYLHVEKNLLHGDIKTDNVLYDQEKNIAKICDFGVSLQMTPEPNGKYLVRKNLSEFYYGSEWYQPKELRLKKICSVENLEITDRCDVWAFGLLLYEMITLKPPYVSVLEEKMNESGHDISYDEDRIEELIGTTPVLPEELYLVNDEVFHLFQSCTEEDFTLRPPFHKISDYWNSKVQNS